MTGNDQDFPRLPFSGAVGIALERGCRTMKKSRRCGQLGTDRVLSVLSSKGVEKPTWVMRTVWE